MTSYNLGQPGSMRELRFALDHGLPIPRPSDPVDSNPAMAGYPYILASNLVSALVDAINLAKKREAQHGPDFRSAYRAGLEECLADLRKHGTIEVKWCDLSA